MQTTKNSTKLPKTIPNYRKQMQNKCINNKQKIVEVETNLEEMLETENLSSSASSTASSTASSKRASSSTPLPQTLKPHNSTLQTTNPNLSR